MEPRPPREALKRSFFGGSESGSDRVRDGPLPDPPPLLGPDAEHLPPVELAIDGIKRLYATEEPARDTAFHAGTAVNGATLPDLAQFRHLMPPLDPRAVNPLIRNDDWADNRPRVRPT